MSERVPDTADVVVVGAGTGGAVAARRIAASGPRVVLLDRLPADDVGRKVCGNALTADGVAAVQRRIAPPSGVEIAMRVRGGALLLPGGQPPVALPREGVVLNRLVFGQRLLRDAIDAGAEFVGGCACVGWADRDACRIRVRHGDDRESEMAARVVVDATGYRGVLTRSGGPSHADALSREDVGVACRDIAPTVEPFETSPRAVVALSPDGAEGGYGWVFPMGERLANVGVGAPLTAGAQAVKAAFRRFREREGGPAFLSAIDSGTGLLPLRPPLASMVGRGFVTVGDAACQTNPLHGGGIAPSIIGGAMAGEVVVRAVARGAAPVEALWPYNVSFMREVGAVHAAHDVLRRFLWGLEPRDLAFLATALWRTGAASALSGPAPRLAVQDVLRLGASATARPGLALALARTARVMESARRLYEGYPESPEGLDAWMRRAGALRRAPGGTAGGGQA
jgi:digeranylgeranylglycerophospholipid reductase